MSKQDKQGSLFHLEGRFLGFGIKDGYKIKYLHIATAEGESTVKLSKESRVSIGGVITPGDWLQVWGEKTVKSAGEVKLKATRISVASPGQISQPPQPSPAIAKKPAQAKSSILVCQKSDCMKRGGKGVCKALEAALSDRGLTDQVSIRGTGCMKHCKAGPNIVFMPDKTRYSRISAEDIPALVDQHFPAPVESNDVAAPNEVESCPVPQPLTAYGKV